MLTVNLRAAAATSGLLLLALAGCGQSASSYSSPAPSHASAASQPATLSATGPASPSASSSAAVKAGHQSPEAAASGFLSATIAGQHTTACAYEAPAQRPSCQQAAGPVNQPATSGGFVIRGQLVAGRQALVEVTGSVCLPGSGCTQNTDPAYGMPASAAGFQQAYNTALNQGGFSPVPCVKVNGEWFVAS